MNKVKIIDGERRRILKTFNRENFTENDYVRVTVFRNVVIFHHKNTVGQFRLPVGVNEDLNVYPLIFGYEKTCEHLQKTY